MNIIFTVCNRLQLPNAMALGTSVLQFHPDSVFYIGWADTVPLPKLQNGIKLISVEDIDVPEWGQMCSNYYDFEIVAAARPWFAKGILKKQKACEKLTFLAPTTLLFSSTQEIGNESAELLLTPHITKPLVNSKILDDKRVLNIGMFHSGSWVIKPGEETSKLLDWWSHRTIDRAKFDLCNGMCMDQLWLNYAPVWVKNTVQIQHAGWHYGLHSVLNKNLKEENGSFFVDDEKLISVDFAGLGNYHPVWSEHTRLVNQNNVFKKLLDKYQHSLKKYEKINGEPGFGRPSHISSRRVLRRNIAGKLKAITKFVDQFQGQ
ncbi:hypothetical protein SAMN04487995_1268 [Dyadobacter koreensis]|uniref:Uncharacterized protein n=1 Tax=Dyadobacter koreensis TaxID=408657 RepID=A0A1H6RF56_9BACT|nr:hypothetical protein [Dyadobacter koreensis]SEI54421.1 hypothetical protein SAMN04487995_1268 [Dyadobacter koreensis]